MRNTIYTVQIADYPLVMTHAEAASAKAKRAAWVAERKPYGGEFYFPRTGFIYRSRSAAMAKKRLIESYGAKAVVFEAEPQWVDVEIASNRRRLDRAAQRAAKLREQADEIMRQAETA